MEEIENLTLDDVLELIHEDKFPIIPLRNRIVISTNVEEYEDDDVNLSGQGFDEEQYVIAVGSHVNILKPGMKIMLNLDAMTVMEENPEDRESPLKRIMLRPVEAGKRFYGMITDDKVDYIIR